MRGSCEGAPPGATRFMKAGAEEQPVLFFFAFAGRDVRYRGQRGQAGTDEGGVADLVTVAPPHESHHQASDQLIDRAHSASSLIRCASRLCNVCSSMNPGLAS